MRKSLLMVITLGLSACGQQPARKPTQSAETKPQIHAAATSQKGQIVQPAVRPGKAADGSSVLISFHGCADLLLLDPRGRKLGYDTASHKSYINVPGGIYDEGDPISDDEQDAKEQVQEKRAGKQPDCIADKTVQFPDPGPGRYTLTMSGNRTPPFKLEITSYGPDAKANGHYVVSQPAGSTPPTAFEFQLPPGPGKELQVKAVSSSPHQ